MGCPALRGVFAAPQLAFLGSQRGGDAGAGDLVELTGQDEHAGFGTLEDACGATLPLPIEKRLAVVVGAVLLMAPHSLSELVEGLLGSCLGKHRFVDIAFTGGTSDQARMTLGNLTARQGFARGRKLLELRRRFDVALRLTLRGLQFIASDPLRLDVAVPTTDFSKHL